MLYKTIIN